MCSSKAEVGHSCTHTYSPINMHVVASGHGKDTQTRFKIDFILPHREIERCNKRLHLQTLRAALLHQRAAVHAA